MESQIPLAPLVSNIISVIVGAAIASFSAYFVTSRRDGENIAKEQAARRLALYEEVALHVGSVQYAFQKYWALIIEALRFKDNWPKARREELDLVTEELVIAFKNLSTAESKLLLLNEKPLNKILKIYSTKIAHFRKTYYVGKAGVSEEELNDIKKDVGNLRDKFFDLLGMKYSVKPS